MSHRLLRRTRATRGQDRRGRSFQAGTVVLGAMLLAACAAPNPPAASPSVTTTAPPIRAGQPTTAAVPAGPARATGSAAAWSGFALPAGAVEMEHFTDLGVFVNSATVVLLGRILGPGPTVTLSGDPGVPEDVSTVPSVRVEVLDVLAGELVPGSGTQVVTITGLRVPEGGPSPEPGILFLRHHRDPRYLPEEPDLATIADPAERAALVAQRSAWRAFSRDKYHLVNTQGVLTASGGVTVAPARPDAAADPLLASLVGRPFAEVEAAIRAVAGRPELAAPGSGVCCEPPGAG